MQVEGGKRKLWKGQRLLEAFISYIISSFQRKLIGWIYLARSVLYGRGHFPTNSFDARRFGFVGSPEVTINRSVAPVTRKGEFRRALAGMR